jgi:hypothetical protein
MQDSSAKENANSYEYNSQGLFSRCTDLVALMLFNSRSNVFGLHVVR